MITAIDSVDKDVEQGKTVFTILSASGDDRLAWDAADPAQVKEAIEKFDEMMQQGYVAFLVDKRGKQKQQITRADWTKKSVRQAEEILFKEPREVRMVAPVTAG
jgi:hypothetical protein